MENGFDVAIIGGGFSGLVAAVLLKSENPSLKIAVFEKNDRLGKKIAVTGNGRGNITNANITIGNYHGNNNLFAKHAIEKYDGNFLKEFFGRLGLLFCEENGRIYPASFQANSISDALRSAIDKLKINVFLSTKINSVKKSGTSFLLENNSGKIISKKILFCFGGKSAPNFGSDGSAYSLLEKLGHTVTKTYPVLVRLITDKNNIKGLKGIKANAELRLYDKNKLINTVRGDLLFNDSGISGNSVFYLSSFIPELNSPIIYADFLPEYSEAYLTEFLLNKIRSFPDYNSEELLNGIVHRQLGRVIIKKITAADKLSDFGKQDVNAIAKLIKNYELIILGNFGFEDAQVTRGGISTDEFDERTLESKITKGIYAAGELLDIDGDCGGYNLQWAFSSASLATYSILKELYGNN